MMKVYTRHGCRANPLLGERAEPGRSCKDNRDVEGLSLSPLQLSDASFLLTLFSEHVWGNLGLKPVNTLQRVRAFISGEGPNQDHRLGVWHQQHGLIGSVAYGIAAEEAFISYWISPVFQRRGYGRQAVTLLLALVRQQGVRRIMADVYQDNLPSQALLQSFGFCQYEQLDFYKNRPATRWQQEIEPLLTPDDCIEAENCIEVENCIEPAPCTENNSF
jgi:RimJ/RimL family protein N-acetyltransferase